MYPTLPVTTNFPTSLDDATSLPVAWYPMESRPVNLASVYSVLRTGMIAVQTMLGASGVGAFVRKDLGTTQGDTMYWTASGAVARMAKGSANTLYKMNAGATAPAWSTVFTASDATGRHDISLSVNGVIGHYAVNVNAGASAAAYFAADIGTAALAGYQFGANATGTYGGLANLNSVAALLAFAGGTMLVGHTAAQSLWLITNNIGRIKIDSAGVATLTVAPILATLTGYLYGNGASAVTAAATIPEASIAATYAVYRSATADHTHATTGAQAGTVAHSVLTGLTTGDPHSNIYKWILLHSNTNTEITNTTTRTQIGGAGATVTIPAGTLGITRKVVAEFVCAVKSNAGHQITLDVELGGTIYAQFQLAALTNSTTYRAVRIVVEVFNVTNASTQVIVTQVIVGGVSADTAGTGHTDAKAVDTVGRVNGAKDTASAQDLKVYLTWSGTSTSSDWFTQGIQSYMV